VVVEEAKERLLKAGQLPNRKRGKARAKPKHKLVKIGFHCTFKA
jgi:hypothetical protein